ncbi:MAG: hypothetical protein EPN97_15750 [Alphaproteobacteria bacterium]|nr:MAG: hypothetical protein EPN97_15750 [Alphaproteobacteria bacterium]
MKSSFNKSSSPQEIVDFIAKTFSNAKNYQDALETVALALLPLIRESRGNLDTKARNMPLVYDMLVEDLDYFDLSDKLTSIPRETIADFLKGTSIGQAASPEDLLKQATQIKSQIFSLSEEDYLALSGALDSVLPPGIRAAMEAADDVKDPVEAAREIRSLAASLSPQEIAAALAEREKRLTPESFADGAHDLLQQCTPGRLEKFVGYMNDNVGGAALGLLVKRFWEFSEELLQAAEDGNFMKLNSPAKARAFGRALCDTLTSLEEGLQQAGFTLPEQLSQYAAEASNTRKVLRAAAALKGSAEAHQGLSDGITINRPIKYKKPGFQL